MDPTPTDRRWALARETSRLARPQQPTQRRCQVLLLETKIRLVGGETFWNPTDDDVAQNACNEYCEDQMAQDKAEKKFGSATCFKNDGKPWVNDQGKEPSDESPLGERIVGVGQCICDWPMLNDLVEDIVTKGLPAVGECLSFSKTLGKLTSEQITCKVFYTAIETVMTIGLNAIPGFGGAAIVGVGLAAQAAEVMAWTFSEPNEALKHYTAWLQHPAGGDSEPAEEAPSQSTSLMDKVCGNKYTTLDAEKIFNSFQFAANFASAPRLFAGAARSWPPPFLQGKGGLDDAFDFIKDLGKGKGKGDGDKDKPKPKPMPMHPRSTEKQTRPAPPETTVTSNQTQSGISRTPYAGPKTFSQKISAISSSRGPKTYEKVTMKSAGLTAMLPNATTTRLKSPEEDKQKYRLDDGGE